MSIGSRAHKTSLVPHLALVVEDGADLRRDGLLLVVSFDVVDLVHLGRSITVFEMSKKHPDPGENK